MPLSSRLSRLEKRITPPDGRCFVCRARPEFGLQIFRQDSIDAEPSLKKPKTQRRVRLAAGRGRYALSSKCSCGLTKKQSGFGQMINGKTGLLPARTIEPGRAPRVASVAIKAHFAGKARLQSPSASPDS